MKGLVLLTFTNTLVIVYQCTAPNMLGELKALVPAESQGRSAEPGGMLGNVTESINQSRSPKVFKHLK